MTARRVQLSGLAILLASATTSGIHVPIETRRVPVDRLIANLEREITAEPANVQAIVNLARVESMAYALKLEDFPAVESRDKKTDAPFFPPGWQTPRTVQTAPSAEQGARAARHLENATRHFGDALALAPDHMTARLGYGFVLQQAGKRDAAIEQYRKVIAQAWPAEQKVRGLMPSQRFLTHEAADYLLELLDSKRDAAEIQDLLAKKKEMESKPRAITPIAIPLEDDLPLSAIVDPLARVRFDADGSALGGEWTWITPRAGWLVYDWNDRGEITSALQLFGNVTFWLFWRNGYDALGSLDDDGSGRLEGNELRHLAIWRDANGNGRSDAGEVKPLAAHRITALSVDHCISGGSDHRIAAFAPRGATLADGRTRPTYDVILEAAASKLTRR